MKGRNNSLVKLMVCIFALFLLSACQSNQPEKTMTYDQNSWKTMIPESCVSYFDGCNNCRREPGAQVAACTRKMCAEYKKPKCLD